MTWQWLSLLMRVPARSPIDPGARRGARGLSGVGGIRLEGEPTKLSRAMDARTSALLAAPRHRIRTGDRPAARARDDTGRDVRGQHRLVPAVHEVRMFRGDRSLSIRADGQREAGCRR